jgi:hypothetical protein
MKKSVKKGLKKSTNPKKTLMRDLSPFEEDGLLFTQPNRMQVSRGQLVFQDTESNDSMH